MKHRRLPAMIATVASVILAGCQTASTTHGHNQPIAASNGNSPSQGPANPEAAVGTEPCTIHLRNMQGLLLLYYATYQQLPVTLEDLAPLADADQPLELTCPVSNLHYVYIPEGLSAPGKTQRIIVHDAAATHNGNRWCIIMSRAKPGIAPWLDVREMPESIFRIYNLLPK